jgi:transposase
MKTVTLAVGEMIERCVEVNSGITLKIIKEILLNDSNINISITSICRFLHDCKLTLKRRGVLLDRVNDDPRLDFEECLQPIV